MQIKRHGKTIDLTPDELLVAYLEQQYLFDMDSVCDNLYDILSELGCPERYKELIACQDFLSDAAGVFRESVVEANFRESLCDAVKDSLKIYDTYKREAG